MRTVSAATRGAPYVTVSFCCPGCLHTANRSGLSSSTILATNNIVSSTNLSDRPPQWSPSGQHFWPRPLPLPPRSRPLAATTGSSPARSRRPPGVCPTSLAVLMVQETNPQHRSVVQRPAEHVQAHLPRDLNREPARKHMRSCTFRNPHPIQPIPSHLNPTPTF